MKRIRRIVAPMIGALIAISSFPLAASGTPIADRIDQSSIGTRESWTETTYSVINKTLVSSSYTDTSQRLSSCRATGGTCTATASISATRTVGLSLGVSRKKVTASLNISNATTVGYSTSCSSPTLKSGQIWTMHPVGSRYRYQVKKSKVRYQNGLITTYPSETSGWLYAFNPRANDIDCRIR